MKHVAQEQIELFGRLLRSTGTTVSEREQATLVSYLDAIIESNLSLNLTRISDPEAGVRLHLLDSLMAAPEVLEAPAGPLVDIGTGGGFPGVPLCVACRRHGILLDSVGKKARAVNTVLDGLGLGEAVQAVHERAEDHARHSGAFYAVVTARAVAELPALVELASPLLVVGGRLVALKGAPDDLELSRGRKAAELVGMREVSVRHEVLSGGTEKRCFVVYERQGAASALLPRKPGEAQRSPLA